MFWFLSDPPQGGEGGGAGEDSGGTKQALEGSTGSPICTSWRREQVDLLVLIHDSTFSHSAVRLRELNILKVTQSWENHWDQPRPEGPRSSRAPQHRGQQKQMEALKGGVHLIRIRPVLPHSFIWKMLSVVLGWLSSPPGPPPSRGSVQLVQPNNLKVPPAPTVPK